MKQKSAILKDRCVAVVAIVSVTVIVLTSLALGINIRADLFGVFSVQTYTPTEQAKGLKDEIIGLVNNGKYEDLYMKFKSNSENKNMPLLNDFQSTVQKLRDHNERIKVAPQNIQGQENQMKVDFGGQIFIIPCRDPNKNGC